METHHSREMWQQQMLRKSESVDQMLETLLPGNEDEPQELVEAIRYSCLAPGKRLRPILVLSSAEAFGAGETQWNAALRTACAVEMIHCFSLIHDDLPAIDNDDLRRGRPTCHKKFGEAVAILAGDALFALAFETISQLGIESGAQINLVQILAKSAGMKGLVSGETIDILSEGKAVDERTLNLIHTRKTGALIAASCEMGAICGGASDVDRLRLKRYGEKIGLAFQIADDVLNVIGDSSQTGKSVGSDAERGKATYVGVFGLEESRRKAFELCEEAISTVEGLKNEPFLSELARFSVDRLT